MKKRSSWQIQRAVIFALLMREIKTRFGGHWTGVVWLLGTPLAQTFMLVAINTFIRGRLHSGIYDYAIFLIVAVIPFRLSTGLWSQLMNAAKANQGLFNYRQVRPLDTLAARAILDLVIDLLVLVASMLVLARLGFWPLIPAHPGLYLVVWALFFLMGLGMGMLLAALIGPMPRLGFFMQFITMPLFILSGIIFSIRQLPSSMVEWLLINPLLHLVELARVAYLPGYVPDQGINLGYPALFTLTVCCLGLTLCWVRRVPMAAGK